MHHTCALDRRRFLIGSAVWAGLAVPSTPFQGSAAAQAKQEPADEDEIPPIEDLMRQHAVTDRLLLIYEEEARRLQSASGFEPSVLSTAAELIRSFLEDYHQKLEEDFVFPRFRKIGRLVELIDLLSAQHQAGRRLTDQIRRLAVAATAKNESDRRQLSDCLHSFLRMQRPHQAREDTILFPKFRKLVSTQDYDDLGEQFEKRADQKFGEAGFTQAVSAVTRMEQQLGIYDLAQFTPK